MTAAACPPDAASVPGKAPTRTFGWWAMACTCATEASLFAYLIAANFYLDLRSPRWPPPGIARPGLFKPLVMTAVLLSSSAVLIWGERGLKRGNTRRLVTGLLGTVILAAVFLALFATEYHDKLARFGPGSSAYASIFYTTTSLHCAHVIVGVLLLSYTMLRALHGHFSAAHRNSAAVATLYWHFVGVIWLAVLTTFYLAPHLA